MRPCAPSRHRLQPRLVLLRPSRQLRPRLHQPVRSRARLCPSRVQRRPSSSRRRLRRPLPLGRQQARSSPSRLLVPWSLPSRPSSLLRHPAQWWPSRRLPSPPRLCRASSSVSQNTKLSTRLLPRPPQASRPQPGAPAHRPRMMPQLPLRTLMQSRHPLTLPLRPSQP